MEFSRVGEWISDIQMFLNFYTEQTSGFEDAHHRQVRADGISKEDAAKGEKL